MKKKPFNAKTEVIRLHSRIALLEESQVNGLIGRGKILSEFNERISALEDRSKPGPIEYVDGCPTKIERNPLIGVGSLNLRLLKVEAFLSPRGLDDHPPQGARPPETGGGTVTTKESNIDEDKIAMRVGIEKIMGSYLNYFGGYNLDHYSDLKRKIIIFASDFLEKVKADALDKCLKYDHINESKKDLNLIGDEIEKDIAEYCLRYSGGEKEIQFNRIARKIGNRVIQFLRVEE